MGGSSEAGEKAASGGDLTQVPPLPDPIIRLVTKTQYLCTSDSSQGSFSSVVLLIITEPPGIIHPCFTDKHKGSQQAGGAGIPACFLTVNLLFSLLFLKVRGLAWRLTEAKALESGFRTPLRIK